MTKTTWTLGLAVVAALASGRTAHAQIGYPPRTSASSPGYSPYLNLLRPGNVANNYFGLVRPQIDAQYAFNGIQQQIGTLNQNINNVSAVDQAAGPLTTGHAATFMNYGHYFPGAAGARAGGARPGAARR
jgi:hypothetical protein